MSLQVQAISNRLRIYGLEEFASLLLEQGSVNENGEVLRIDYFNTCVRSSYWYIQCE